MAKQRLTLCDAGGNSPAPSRLCSTICGMHTKGATTLWEVLLNKRYTIGTRGQRPPDLAERVAQVHAAAIEARHREAFRSPDAQPAGLMEPSRPKRSHARKSEVISGRRPRRSKSDLS